MIQIVKDKIVVETSKIIPSQTTSGYKLNTVNAGNSGPINKNQTFTVPKDKIGIWFKSGDNRYHHRILDARLIFEIKTFFRALGLYHAEGLKSIRKKSKYAISFANGNPVAINIIINFFRTFLNKQFKWRVRYHRGYQKYLYDQYRYELTEKQVKSILQEYWIKHTPLRRDYFYFCYRCNKSNLNYTRVPLLGVCYIETCDLMIRGILDLLLSKVKKYLLLNKQFVPYYLQGLWGGDGSLSIRPKHKSLHFIRLSGIIESEKKLIKELFFNLDLLGRYIKDKSVREFRVYNYSNFLTTAKIQLYYIRSGNEYQLGELDFINALFKHAKHKIFSLLYFFKRGHKTTEIIPKVKIAYRTIDMHLNTLAKERYLSKRKRGRDSYYTLTKKGQSMLELFDYLKQRKKYLENFIRKREHSFIEVIPNCLKLESMAVEDME